MTDRTAKVALLQRMRDRAFDLSRAAGRSYVRNGNVGIALMRRLQQEAAEITVKADALSEELYGPMPMPRMHHDSNQVARHD